MNLTFTKKPSVANYRLRRRDFQRIRSIKPGSSITCNEGVIWVTQANDRRDYVLRPGDHMKVGRGGKVLVEAIADADLQID